MMKELSFQRPLKGDFLNKRFRSIVELTIPATYLGKPHRADQATNKAGTPVVFSA